MGQQPLVRGLDPSADMMIKEHVSLLVLGKLLPEWWQGWDARPRWSSEEGVIDGWERTSWEEQFERSVQKPRQRLKMEKVGEEEKAALLDMLKAVVVFIKPEKRITADQIEKFKWMHSGHFQNSGSSIGRW
jgi:serine/threonine-protein kinase SRPK3